MNDSGFEDKKKKAKLTFTFLVMRVMVISSIRGGLVCLGAGKDAQFGFGLVNLCERYVHGE